MDSILSVNPLSPSIDETKLFTTLPNWDRYESADYKWVNDIKIDTNYLAEISKKFESINLTELKVEDKKQLLLKIVEFIDLTTLGGDDTDLKVNSLTLRALEPLNTQLKTKLLGNGDIHTAAVCVYPARVNDVLQVLNNEEARNKVKIASVAAGFPSGQYLLDTRLHEIKLLVEQNIDEIDIVIQRSLVLSKQWLELFNEIKAMKQTCGNCHMKTILAVGELKTSDNIYCASMIAMMAGSDFIKTSTGKEKTNATIPAGIIMCVAIQHYFKKTGKRIGLKPAGGISTFEDSVKWIYLVASVLGKEWLNKDLFRIGASSLLDNIVKELELLVD